MSFFEDLDKENDGAVLERFEQANTRDDFEYSYKMFSKALDAVLPKREADPFIADYKFLSKRRFMIRNQYEAPGQSLREEGKKVQKLIDDYIRSLDTVELMKMREITYENFLGDIAKLKLSQRARTALIKNKARQIIQEFAPKSPAYYEKLKERLEKIIEQEEERRKDTADYFEQMYKKIFEEALRPEQEQQKHGITSPLQFAIFEELSSIKRENDENNTKIVTEKIFNAINK